MTPEATMTALSKFNHFPLFEDAWKTYFDPDSTTYFGTANEELFTEAANQGQFPKEITWDQIQVGDKYFNLLAERQDLIDIINAPAEGDVDDWLTDRSPLALRRGGPAFNHGTFPGFVFICRLLWIRLAG